MNPDTAIKPWLVAYGRQHKIREAHNYHWPDASTRPQEAYFTYRVLRGHPVHKNINRANEQDGYTAIHKAWQSQQTIVRVKLYREVNGVEILTKCAIAAMMYEPFKAHFAKSGCAIQGVIGEIEDDTPDDLDVSASNYLDQIVQHMDVVFNDNVHAEIREENGIVESLEIDLWADE